MTKAYDILNGTGVTDPNPAFKTAAERYPHHELKVSLPVPEDIVDICEAMTAEGKAAYLRGDFVEPDANAGLMQAAGIAGGINGAPAAAGTEAPLREFVMCSPPRGGWVILSQRYGNPIAAFTSFKEACDWLEPRVAK